MNDEAAESRGPSGPAPDVPAPTAPATEEPAAENAPPAAPTSATEPDTEPIVPDDPPPPPPPGPFLPPWAAGPSFSRDQLVRPKQGRYVAGVCAALGRATNTDPVLWRVLLAVLGVLSGVGVLLYLIGWLVIPAEGDTASPIESLLGRGRSTMAPLSIILLGCGALLSFAFIVNDGMRASLLAAAVVLGAVLLIKRSGPRTGGEPVTFPFSAPHTGGEPVTFPFSAPHTGGEPATFPFSAPRTDGQPATFPFGGSPTPGPVPPPTTGAEPTSPPEPPPAAPQFAAPATGYRPPFAPHGPYAGPPLPPYLPGPKLKAPKAPKPPRERSKLGRLTFFAVVMVIGVMAVIDMAGASIAVSAYFAAALVTIGLGLVVGAWLGRARGLIALALITTLGLLVSTGTERWGGEVGNSVYRPATLGAIADRYDFTAGNATLDLRAIDFAKQKQDITVTMKLGQLKVLLPKLVDTTTTLRMDNGRAVILGKVFDGQAVDGQSVTDLGTDGDGGGKLTLDLQMDTGNVEVTR
jgi:phage shock protein PspC (stress-responsive transcriptional regulator)